MPEVMPAVVELSQRTQEAVSDAQFGLGKLAGLASSGIAEGSALQFPN
jgi:hypothetical protein